MKGLMILANGFEDVEAIGTIDVLKRANVNLTVASMHHKEYVCSAHNNKVLIETYIKDIDYKAYDFLIIPGGKAVFNELNGNKLVDEIVKHFCDNNK